MDLDPNTGLEDMQYVSSLEYQEQLPVKNKFLKCFPRVKWQGMEMEEGPLIPGISLEGLMAKGYEDPNVVAVTHHPDEDGGDGGHLIYSIKATRFHREDSWPLYLREVEMIGEVWNPILDWHSGLALTPDSFGCGHEVSTKIFTGTDNQLWRMDAKGMIINKESGLVIDGKEGRPNMQRPTPLRSSMQWKLRSDLRCRNEGNFSGTVTLPKLVEEGRQLCLNTMNRRTNQRSALNMCEVYTADIDTVQWHFVPLSY
eukprot:GFUD01014950.1.p1 GENE.GFUD01014950.1~~GFUD01014950.1.p1  ORF type:complete len:256 (+),score=53.91 GFUD01014950.1:61-828(+)